MHLSDAEVKRLMTLTSVIEIRVYLAARRFSPIFVPPGRILAEAQLTGAAQRRGRLALAKFCKARWLEKETRRRERGSWCDVRYVAAFHGGSQEITRGGSLEITHSFKADTDLPSRRERPEPFRPSVGRGPERGVDGRTDADRKFAQVPEGLAGSIADAWNLDRPVVDRVLGRFLAEVPGLTERELQRFLRAALLHRDRRRLHPAFADIEGSDRFFGRACVAWRYAKWREDPKATHGPSSRYREFTRDDAGELTREQVAERAARAEAAQAELAERERREREAAEIAADVGGILRRGRR